MGLVSRRNGVIVVNVYRKPTHTDRYLDFYSHHNRQHKVSTASSLLHRALNLPNSSEGKKRELNYVQAALALSKAYTLERLELLQQMFPWRNSLECFSRWLNQPSHASLLLLSLNIKGVTEPLTRILKKHDVTVVNKPFTTLQQQFPVPKFRPSMESQTNVYKIPCTNCSWCYIGETGIAFNTRKKEHLRNTKTAAKGSRIANHAWSNNHAIDFKNASVIDKGTFRTRKNIRSVAYHCDT